MKSSLILALAMLVVVSCGKNDTLDLQESQRQDIHEGLQGNWTSPCSNRTTSALKFEGDVLTATSVQFYDRDCTAPKTTLSQTGTYKLANNYKSGVNNSFILVPNQAVTVTYEDDRDLNNVKNALNRVATETLQTIPAGADKATTMDIERANKATRELKKVEDISRSVGTTFNRLQLEKLAALGVNIGTILGIEGNSSLRYEFDNGYLILNYGQRDDRLTGIANVYARQ